MDDDGTDGCGLRGAGSEGDRDDPQAFARRVLDALDEPARWPDRAVGWCAPQVRWQCPARGLAAEGAAGVRARWIDDASLIDATPPVTLRRSICGARVFHESVVGVVVPRGGVPGLAMAAGTRVELKRLRVLTLEGGAIVDERVLETWSALPA
jgi:hypothetical protein